MSNKGVDKFIENDFVLMLLTVLFSEIFDEQHHATVCCTYICMTQGIVKIKFNETENFDINNDDNM